MCYRDMTFCPFWRACKVGKDCPRAYTPEVEAGAKAWMGDKAPVCYYMELPHCFDDNGHKGIDPLPSGVSPELKLLFKVVED